MEVGLFFGSFNPIHIGHMIIANLAYESTSIDQVWFIVSPQNPHKSRGGLLHEFDRLDMVRAATYDHFHFQASDIEFGLPKPSYTINTLTHLSEKYPQHQFRLIIGEDNLKSFPKWKNHEQILNQHGLIVYPRPGVQINEKMSGANVSYIEAPLIDISASLIRQLIKTGKSVKLLVPDPVWELIQGKGFYQ
ncbi:MAG: nicotinate-nucleotide adenylyltransferase [Cyclobacteriaceae bacterium]